MYATCKSTRSILMEQPLNQRGQLYMEHVFNTNSSTIFNITDPQFNGFPKTLEMYPNGDI